MSANTTPLREKVNFQPNEPQVMRLDYDDGTLSPGRFGDQYQYTFDHGKRIAWLDPEVRDLILKSGARAGDEIGICKRVAQQGRAKKVTWEVAKVEDEPAQPQHPANAAYEAEWDARDGRTRPEQREGAGEQARRQRPEQKPLDNAREEFALREARLYADCLLAAVHATLLAAQANAEAENLAWQPVDIRSIATTMYIQAHSGGGK